MDSTNACTESSQTQAEDAFRNQYAQMLRQLKHLDASVLQETDMGSEYVLNLSAITNASRYIARAVENESVIGDNNPLHSTVINAPLMGTTSRLNNTPESCENEFCGERSRYTPYGSDASGSSQGDYRNIDLLLNTSLSTYNYNGMHLYETTEGKRPLSSRQRDSRETTPSHVHQETWECSASSSQRTGSETRLTGNSDSSSSRQYGMTSCETDSRANYLHEGNASVLGVSMAVNTSFTICEEADTTYDGYEIDLDDMDTLPQSPLHGNTRHSSDSSVWSPELQPAEYAANCIRYRDAQRQHSHRCGASKPARPHSHGVYEHDTQMALGNGPVHISSNNRCSSHDGLTNRNNTTPKAGEERGNHYMHTARPTPEGKEATPIYSQMSQKNLHKHIDCSPKLKPHRHSVSQAKLPSSHSIERLTDDFETMELKRRSRALYHTEQSHYYGHIDVPYSATMEHSQPEISHNASHRRSIHTRNMHVPNNTMLSTASTLANRDCKMVCMPVNFMKSNVFKKMRKLGKKVNETQGKSVSSRSANKETTFQMLGSV